jgi:hypothetical protein
VDPCIFSFLAASLSGCGSICVLHINASSCNRAHALASVSMRTHIVVHREKGVCDEAFLAGLAFTFGFDPSRPLARVSTCSKVRRRVRCQSPNSTCIQTITQIDSTNALITPHMTETMAHHQALDQYPNQPMYRLTRLSWYMVRGREQETCMRKVVGA